MDYFKQTSPNEYRFLDYYLHCQKQDDFTYSFRREADKLQRCLTLLAYDKSEDVRIGTARLLSSFEGHRTKYEDVNIFWKQIESENSIDSAEIRWYCCTALTSVEEKMKQNRKCASVDEERFPKINKYVTPTRELPSDNSPTLPHRKRMREDLQPNLVETVGRSATKIYLQIVKIYFTILDTLLNDPYVFVDENNKETKLTEMEFVLKTVAPVMDIIFSDINHLVRLRWGETVSKASTACRKIDLKIETRGQCIELSHTECARSPTPAKICILDNILKRNISDQAVEDSAVFAFQFAGLYGQLLAVDLFDNGLYFCLEGPDFKFPSQLPNIKPLRQTLEERIIQKATILLQFDTQINPYKKIFHSIDEKQPEPKHKKIKFIRSTYFTPRK
ncbi:9227_t:CDS:10, partial [Funneliformis mosseae]